MASVFLKFTLLNGKPNELIGEFAQLAKIQKYIMDVFNGKKPLNLWRVTGNAHPHSGEPVLVRTRQIVNPANVGLIEQVERKPDASADSYKPTDFIPVTLIAKGALGLWRAPEGIDGAVPNTMYPIHQDDRTLRKFVILTWAEDPAAQTRHYLDGGSSGFAASVSGGRGRGRSRDDFHDDDDDEADL